MLTPKRLLLVIAGFAVLFAGYLVYAHFLGHYDEYQPLPPEYRPGKANGESAPAPAVARNIIVSKLEEAFGANCEEVHRRIKLQWPTQGVVMAAQRYKFSGGKLELFHVSVAHFGKLRRDAKAPEVNTIRGDAALVEFDKPVNDLRDAQSVKPVAGQIRGNVRLHNNRGTPDPQDDIRLFTPSLSYRDDQHRIWTEDEIVVKDSDPELRMVRAVGLEVVLVPGDPPPNKDAKKPGRPTFTGIKHVRLERDVQMTMLIDSQSTFLGARKKSGESRDGLTRLALGGASGGAAGIADASAARLAARNPVVVNCQGHFVYYEDAEHDKAEFNDRVTVIRTVEAQPSHPSTPTTPRYDQLDCDKLVLTFSRKNRDTRKPAPDDPAAGIDLLSAHATGKAVELVSDTERLHATGTDMLYDKAASTTTLRGDPVVAEQAGHQMRLRGVLTLHSSPDGKELREARARGPGEIRMRRDQQPEIFARWQDELVTVKEGTSDRLTLTGRANFEDPLRGKLQADQLVVWIDAVVRPPVAGHVKPPTAEKNDAPLRSAARDRTPRRLEASGNVSLVSTELVIPRTDRLRLFFEEGKVTGSGLRPPELGPKKPLVGPPSPEKPLGAKPLFLPAPDAGQRQPIELTARLVEAKIVHDGARADLKELRTEGQVQVLQRAVAAGDKALDIKGERLELRGSPEGYVLKITGQPGEPAFVQLDRLSIMGPTVDIDQVQNEACVLGVGSMKLPSKNDFQGNVLKEPMDVTIFWNQRMYFDGKLAEFDDSKDGGVVAVQGGARLACRKLEVILDHAVSFKGREKDQPEPGLYRLWCDQAVRLERGVRYEEVAAAKPGETLLPMILDKSGKPRWREFQRIEAAELAFERQGNAELSAYGPGLVNLLMPSGNRGPQGFGVGAPGKTVAKKPPTPASDELKLTRIEYKGHMQAVQTSKDSTLIKFIDGVELVHFPATDPDALLDLDRLPPGSVYLRAGRLEVLHRKGEGMGSSFVARDRVTVRAREFHAVADIVKYEEAKDQLILEGIGSSSAIIYRQTRPGGPREPISAKQITVWVKDNRIKVGDVDDIRINP